MYTVQDLSQKSFSLRLLGDKLDIANKGRPTPSLPNLVQQYKTKSKQHIRHFLFDSMKMYFAGHAYYFLLKMKSAVNIDLLT